MTSTHLATQPHRQPAAKDTARSVKVVGKARVAIDLMVWEGHHRSKAAELAGMAEKSLYNALRKPHVKAYYLSECEVLRTSGRARRIHRLEEIVEQNDNKQAAVNAIKALDMLDDSPQATAARTSTPGFVINVLNVVQPSPHTPHIRENEHKPLIDHGDVGSSDDER